MITVKRIPDESFKSLINKHSSATLSEELSVSDSFVFEIDGRQRSINVGAFNLEECGLAELIDNNPLVCADKVSVPGPASTLALIALGPVIRAGLLVEKPTMQYSSALHDEDVDSFLKTAGWEDGVDIVDGNEELNNVLAANVMCVIETPSEWKEIDDLYEECYGRSFYVRSIPDGDWDTQLVSHMPFAAYRLRYSVGEETSLLTIQVMADKDGKCGAAQMIHMMNIMCGLEECEGLSV